MTKSRLAVAAVCAVCAVSVVVLWSLPSIDESAELLPWYLEPFFVVGFILAVAPSYVVYRLDQFFGPGSILRDALVLSLIGVEVFIIAWLVHSIAQGISRASSRTD